MSATPDLLDELTRSGVRIEAHGDKLRVKPPPGMDKAALRERLLDQKAALILELRRRNAEVLNRCRTACRNLSLWPAELLAAMTEEDKAAQISGEEGPEVLRAFAESLAARLRTGTLPDNLHQAYERLRIELARNPSIRFASEVLTPDADPVLLAVAVRGAGFATLRIARDRYDEGQLLEIIDRVGGLGNEEDI